MLFKDLKNIMTEADETVASDTPTETAPTTKETSFKPNKFDKQSKDASDGVGAEAYEISNEIGKALETGLDKYYNISGVEVSNNTITVVADKTKLQDGQMTSKRGNVVPDETLLDTIQMLVAAALGSDIDKFNLAGPKSPDIGIYEIYVMPK